MDDIVEDTTVVEDSSPSDTPASPGQTPQAPKPPVDPYAGKPFHQHPRWIQREKQWEEREGNYKRYVQTLTDRIAALETKPAAAVTPNEEREYAEAAQAIKRIFERDPDLKAFYESRNRLPQLEEGYANVGQMQAQARSQQAQTARTHIGQLVKDAGIDVPAAKMQHVVRLVAGAAMQLPNGNVRYDSGDLSVLDEAFEEVKGFIEDLRKGTTATVAQTKAKTKNLPPAPRGGPAGPAAPEGIKPGEERAFQTNLHKKGLALLKERLSS